MVFSMPMFHDWIPRCIRPWLYIVLAFCFQFSNGMYLGAMNHESGKTKCARFEKRNVQKSGKTKRSKNFAHTTL